MSVSERLESLLTTLHGVHGTMKVFENGDVVENHIMDIPSIMTMLSETIERMEDEVSALAHDALAYEVE